MVNDDLALQVVDAVWRRRRKRMAIIMLKRMDFHGDIGRVESQ